MAYASSIKHHRQINISARSYNQASGSKQRAVSSHLLKRVVCTTPKCRGQQRPRLRRKADDGTTTLAARAKQAIDYGRRGKGSIFGAFRPATGDASTRPYDGRTIANWVDFLGHGEAWVPAEIEHRYAIVDNLNVHRATDVLLCMLQHPCCEFVFQPKYAAYLNLIEP